MGKIAIIGLDGLSWDILLRYVNHLPKIHRLLSSSILASLFCKPPLTPPSWTSIFTGVFPKTHQVLGFTKYYRKGSALSHRFYNSKDVAVPRISEILGLNDLTSLLINHVLSYPVSGWHPKSQSIVYDVFSPKKFIFPTSLARYLRFFKYPRIGKFGVSTRAGSRAILRDWAELVSLRNEGTTRLVEEVNPDMLIAVVTETDNAMHRVPAIAAGRFSNEYLEILRHIDSLVGFCTDNFDAVVLVSDHGFQIAPRGLNLQLLLNAVKSDSTVKNRSLRRLALSLTLNNPALNLLFCNLVRSMRTYQIFYRLRKLLRGTLPSDISARPDSTSAITHLDRIDPLDAMTIYFNRRDDRELAHKVAEYLFGRYVKDIEKIDVGGVSSLRIVPVWDHYLLNEPFHRDNPSSIIKFPSVRHDTIGMFLFWRRGTSEARYVGMIRNVDVTPTALCYLDLPLPSYADGSPVISKRNESIDYRRPWIASRDVERFRVRTKNKIG